MEDIRIDGLTADEWEGLANPQAPTNEQLVELGILQEQPQQSTEAPNNTAQPQKAERDDYEDLGYWQTVGDELVAGAVELSKFVTPKKYELQYTPRTRAGEAFQTFSKYLYGIGGLLMGGEVAGVVKAYFQCDLCDGGVRVQKQRLGFLNAQVIDVGNQGLACILLEQFHKVVFAVIRESSKLCCSQRL